MLCYVAMTFIIKINYFTWFKDKSFCLILSN